MPIHYSMLKMSHYWDFFIKNFFYKNHPIPEDPDIRLSHNMFIWAVIVGVFLSFTFGSLYLLNGFLTAGLLQYVVTFICVFCLYLFRKTRSVVLSGQIIFLIMFLASWYRVHSFGGITAPTFYTYVLIPAFSVGFLPVRWAFFWTCNFVLLAIGYHIADQYGVRLPSSIPEGKEATLRIYGIVFANFVVFFVVYSIRRVHKSFQDIINKEKEVKTNMIRLISHDMSGPLMIMQHHMKKLNSLKLNDLSDSQKNNDNYSSTIDKIAKAHHAIKALIENVRQYEAIDSGKIGFKEEVLTLKSILENVFFFQEENMKNKNIIWKISGDSRLEILADPTAVTYQILNNVISNAIKFSDIHSEIEIVCYAERNHVVVKVIDHGIGIPEKILKNLLNFYSPTSRTGTSGEKGTGFGMPIVKAAIEKMGGQMKIESKERIYDQTGKVLNSDYGTTITLKFKNAKN
jgi:signal transduction histidine kinase